MLVVSIFFTIKMSEEQNQVTETSSKTYSKVWNHFNIINDDKAKCIYCG